MRYGRCDMTSRTGDGRRQEGIGRHNVSAVCALWRVGKVRAIGMLRRERRSWMLDSVSLFDVVLAEDA